MFKYIITSPFSVREGRKAWQVCKVAYDLLSTKKISPGHYLLLLLLPRHDDDIDLRIGTLRRPKMIYTKYKLSELCDKTRGNYDKDRVGALAVPTDEAKSVNSPNGTTRYIHYAYAVHR